MPTAAAAVDPPARQHINCLIFLAPPCCCATARCARRTCTQDKLHVFQPIPCLPASRLPLVLCVLVAERARRAPCCADMAPPAALDVPGAAYSPFFLVHVSRSGPRGADQAVVRKHDPWIAVSAQAGTSRRPNHSCCTPSWHAVVGGSTRRQLREQLNLPGTACNDYTLHTFLPFCAVRGPTRGQQSGKAARGGSRGRMCFCLSYGFCIVFPLTCNFIPSPTPHPCRCARKRGSSSIAQCCVAHLGLLLSYW